MDKSSSGTDRTRTALAVASRNRLLLAASCLALMPASVAAQVAGQVPQPAQSPSPSPAPEDAASAVDATQADTATAQNGDGNGADIVVTGSRVVTGLRAPTPTTVVGSEQIQLRATTNVASLLNESPAFKPSSTPATSATSSANAGSNFLNLRSLGAQRTLVLVNGRRHVPTTSAGLVDLNAIPVNLVKRVEVVTGGASAAYGSDAVAGVVNLILDNELKGLRLDAQAGISSRGDGGERRVAGAFGTAIGDRGHFVVGVDYSDSDGVLNQDSRPWGRNGYQVIANPAYTATNGQPQRLIAANVHPVNATEGGVIVSGVLANTQFLPGGATAPFVLGSPRNTAYMVGGDGIHQGKYVSLSVPVERYSIFGRADYEIADGLSFFVEGSYARSQSVNDVIQPFNFGDITIQRDNAFLSTGVRDALLNANQTSFRMGRISTDFGFYTAKFDTKTRRIVAGVDGELGDFKWNAYYQDGQTDYDARLRNRVTARFNNAVDAVINPATGTAACRINVDASTTNDDAACVPVNLFGYGSPSAASINYFMQEQQQKTRVNQQVGEISLRGSPFALPAGAVNIAVGGDYRREKVVSNVDALAIANAYSIGNPKPISGSYDVKEAFGEVLIPLLANSVIARSLDLNAAIRYTDYSTSGSVTTWKVGGTWGIVDGVRLRATRSRDIRAPNIDELFTTGQLRFSSVIDPRTSVQTNVTTLAGGSLTLSPERADTWTAGIVLQPSFAPRLSLSVDFYDIKVKGAIGTLTAQDTVDRCNAGATELCDRVVRDALGNISQVILTQLNLATLATRGVDAEFNYRLPLSGIGSDGTLIARVLSTYIDRLETNDGRTRIDRAGTLGNGLNGIPHWRVNGSLTYQNGGLTIYSQGRFIGGGAYDKTFAANGINDNSIPSRFYVDLSTQQSLGDGRFTLFANVNNLFDRDPPVNPSTTYFTLSTAPEFYDLIGRYFTAGVRLRF